MRIFLLLALSLAGVAQAANNAAFVSQSVPAVMVPGQVYAVSVTMQNNGTTTWTAGAGHNLGTQNAQDNATWTGSPRAALSASVSPGNSATFSFNVTAPSTAGTYNFQWKMVQDGVEWFGAQSDNVAVKVGLNDAAFASQSVPPVMTPGQTYPVTVTMQNTGGKTWTAGTFHGLGSQNSQDNTTWGTNRVALPSTTASGANAAFSFNVTAPTTPGTYNFQWKMVQDGLEWFGALSTNAAIKVGLDNAAFVSQSVPSTMVAGQSYAVSVTMQNTGSTTWAAGTVGIGSQNAQGTTTWGPSKVNLASPVAPSAQTTFNFNVTAPATPGTYNFQWKMVEGMSGWFGAQSTNVAVDVTAGAPAANVYFIHTDHLNTPRLVANSTGATVWRWDQQEPFGVNVPDENPSSLGAFEFPLRFPGQYADKETNLFYNYFRDYDAVLGRYVQSDPLGLAAGLSTYGYVEAYPIGDSDTEGLISTLALCSNPGNAAACAAAGLQTAATSAMLSAGVNAGTQLATGTSMSCIDWGSVGTSAALGFVTGAPLGVAMKAQQLYQGLSIGNIISGAARTQLSQAFMGQAPLPALAWWQNQSLMLLYGKYAVSNSSSQQLLAQSLNWARVQFLAGKGPPPGNATTQLYNYINAYKQAGGKL